MPIYTVQAPDGNIYKVEAPEGATQEQIFGFVGSQMAMRQRAPESAGFNLGDLAASFAQSAYGSTQALTDVFGAGNVASRALEERARASQAGMSVARQAELARQQERLKRAEASGSALEEAKAVLQNIAEAPLQSAAQALGSFAPYIPTMFLGPAAGVLGLGARATAAATNVAKAAPAVIGTAQGAGAVKGAIYDAVYEAERKDGVGEEEARAKAEAAQSYAGNNIDQILLGSGAGYVAGRFGAERLLTPGAAAKASQSVAGRIATAAATDVPTEAFQGGQERLAANLALQREGRDVPTFEGVAGQATQEGLLGLLGSAPVAALRGPDVEALRQEEIKKRQAEFEAEKARALAEMAARPPEPEKPIELPQGYKVMREELGREVGPESYGIFVEGQETPLTTVASEQQALQKIESFKEIRESERETLVEQMEKLNDGIQKTRDRIDYLEATGKIADPEYTKLTTALPDQELAAETKARELAEQVQQLGAPLTFAPIGQKETVREQYNVLSPTNEPLGTFATAGEAEASVRGIIGDEPFKQAEVKKERDERIVALEQQLVPKLKQFGLQDVGLKVVESIENNAGGAYLNKLIRVAYDEANPLQTMRHESLHALKDLGFFTPQQWKALNERAEKQWVQELKNVPFSEGKSRHDAYVEMFTQEGEAKGLSGQQLQNYVRETLNEEAIADAFGAYDRGATPPPGMIAALFKRLKNFFLNFGQALRGAGFESADDIFQRVERGELRGRKPAEAEEKLSLAPKGIPQKIWDLHEKVNKADDEASGRVGRPQGISPGAAKRNQTMTFRRLNQAVMDFVGGDEQKANDLMVKMNEESSRRGEKLSITRKPASDIGHKREASTGRYVGAPDWVGSSPQQLTNLRKKLMRLAEEGEGGRFWYENSSKAILDLVGGDKKEAEKIVGLIAIYSPNATVPANTSMALNAYFQYKAGQPIKAGLGEGNKKAEELLREGKEWSGIKTNSFYQNLMVEIDPSKLDPGVATMDMWMALAFDYGMKALDQGPKYKFAEREIQRLAEELGWDAHQVQAAVWTAMKGRIDPIRDQLKKAELANGIGEMYEKDGKQLYRVKPDRRYDHFRLAHKMGMEYKLSPEDIDQSKYDFSDAIRERSIQMSWEATPGASTGILPGLLRAPINQKFEYLEAINKLLTNAEGYDKISEKIGLPTGKSFFGFSAWQGDIGAGAQTYMGAALRDVKDKRDLTPETRNLLNLYAAIKGLVLSQEAVVYHVPVYDGSIKNQNGIEGKFNRALTEEEMMALYRGLHEKFKTWEIAPGYTPDGFRLLNFTDIDNKTFHKGVQQVMETLPEDFGGGMIDFKSYRSIGDFIGNDWSEAPNGEQYQRQIESLATAVGKQGRPDLLDWAANLRADVAALNKKFSDKYDWGNPGKPVPAQKLSLKAPTSTAFKQWFGDSTVVNEDGTPKVMYHGLAKDTTDFTRKTARGAPIFLTDDPEFAAQFSADSYESVARNPQEYLPKEQIDAGVKRAIAAIKKDYGKDSLGKEMVESLQTGDLKDATPEAREYIQKEFINLLPTGPHIMPLYVRAERPFDYQNPSHIRKVLAELTEDAYDPAEIRSGSWELIESADFQDAIQSAGFDSFYVKEQGRKNLAVYDPNQVKSATGNVGTFSRESPDVRYSLKQVKDIFNRAEEIPMPAGVEFIRDQWIGGVSGIGDRDAMYDLYRVNGSKKYIQDVQDFVRKELGDQFKGYRLMSNDELEELKTGAMGSQFASFTLNPDVARAFKNIPAYSKKSGMSVVEMDLTPEHVNMIGHPGELELVIDYGQGYNPSEIKVIEKYSLKNVAFPSAKEAQEAADAKQAPNTKEFKLFIGASRWLDEDGNPKKFFHATAGNFSEFLEGRIYLSETAKDSEKYGYGAEDRLRASIYRALNKDEKLPLFQRAVDEAVKEGKITAEDGNEFMRQVKRKIPDFGKYNAIKEEVDAELIALSPERMKIMPLYARSETPFDFRNSEHVYQVSSIVDRGDVRLSEEAIQEARRLGVPSEYPDQWYRGLPGLIKQGYPKTIESPQVQKAIRKLGFDGYIVRHNRNAPLTYVVYDNNQVKSVTGNLGDYSLETKDIRYSLKKVRYSDNRFEKLWNESMYTQNDAENKTKGYLAFVDPMDFVRATASPETFERLLQEQEPLDSERMRNYDQVPFLSVSEKNGEWKITGHEGRHRMLALHGAGYNEVPIYIHLRAEDAKSIPVKMLTAQYPDSVSSVLMAAEVEPLSYANKDKAMEKFTRMSSKVKYSLPAIPKAMETRIGETTFRREPEGFFERMTEAISPKNFSYFRQRVLNQYNQLGVYDRKLVEQMGGKELLADQSAEAAALMSDLGAGVAASAMGFGDRNGGIPVYKNGVTTIDRSKKGLIAVLQPLARYGDPKIYQYYQYWAMVKRGVRLNAEGKETGIDNTDVQYAKYLQDKFPEFVTVQKEFIEFNNGLVKYARDTGVISEQNAEAFMRYADYVPFYRQMDGETTVGPNIFQSIAGVKPPKKLKGGTAPLADFLETAVRNTQSMIQAGVKNAAAQRAVGVVTKVKAPGMGAERLDYDANGPDVFHVLENGKRVSYRTPDVLLIDAISSLHLNEIPGIGIVAAPANALRNLVTKDPGFMMANLMRDSLSAWVTSGQKMTPIAGTVINFGKALAKKSKGYEALLDAGVIGGYEFSQNIERSGRQLEEDLSEKAGKKAPLVLRPFKSLWGALERGTEASDAATRALVYERVLNDTGNEAEALFRALEVMNFNRKGNSPLVRILTAGVPFLNARMQGLDLFYRASTGNMNMADKAAIKRQFWLRGSSMFAISAIYWMMVHDEDDYKSQEQETKDNNWIIPSLGIRIPIPFEVGVLFKTIPERIIAYSFGNDTGKDFMESMKRNFMSTFAFNPIPQVVKPVLEAAFNFNPFTWRQIVGQGMQDVAVEYQVGPGTSKVAKAIGENLGLSPMKVDHIIKGYTGTMGMYAIDTIDYIMDQFGDSPKAAKRFEQMPVIKRFAVDPAARGTVTAYYELKDSVDTTVRTMNLLERTMEPEKFAQYVQDNLGPLAVKDYIRDLERTMKELREMRVVIQSSTMSAEEKRDGLLTINQAENNLTKNIQEVKKAIASLK